jgi:chromate transporter
MTTRRRLSALQPAKAVAPAVDRRGVAVAMGLLTAPFGWDGTFTQMGWFFTKAALLTFGGAYAVLRCMHQGRALRLADADADDRRPRLGETTPGPLIMVVAFVGFIGGYVQPSRRNMLRRRCTGGDAGDLVHLPAFVSCSSSPAGRWWSRPTTN